MPDASSFIVEVTAGGSSFAPGGDAGVRGRLPVTSKLPLRRLSYAGLASASIFERAAETMQVQIGDGYRAPYTRCVARCQIELAIVPGAMRAPFDRRLVQRRRARDRSACAGDVIVGHRQVGRQLRRAGGRRKLAQVDVLRAAGRDRTPARGRAPASR